jgi:hypothetical protein
MNGRLQDNAIESQIHLISPEQPEDSLPVAGTVLQIRQQKLSTIPNPIHNLP